MFQSTCIVFEILSFVVVSILWKKCKKINDWIVWFIQFAQLIEIVWLWFHPSFADWRRLDIINVTVELVAFALADSFPAAKILMGFHLILKILEEMPTVTDFEYYHSLLFWPRFWLNDCVIIAFLFYCFKGEKCVSNRLTRLTHLLPLPHPWINRTSK